MKELLKELIKSIDKLSYELCRYNNSQLGGGSYDIDKRFENQIGGGTGIYDGKIYYGGGRG